MMNKSAINSGMLDVGFTPSSIKNLFFVGCGDFIPSILIKVFTKSGLYRIGGTLGIVCPEFESQWKNSLKGIERKVDNSFSVCSHIDNFVAHLGDAAYSYVGEEADFRTRCQIVYRYLEKFPKCASEFHDACLKDGFGGRPFSKLLNISDYFEIDNQYQRKSINFLYWLTKKEIVTPDLLLRLLSKSQIRIISSVEMRNYILPELRNKNFLILENQ